MPQIYSQHFESLGSLVDYVLSNEPDEKHNQPQSQMASRENNPTFYGTMTFEDCLSLVSNGWPDGRKIVGNYTSVYGNIWNKFFPQQDHGNDFRPSESGAIPLVDQVIIGNPDNMLEFFPDEQLTDKLPGGKLQRMIVNADYVCWIDIETVFQRGALIAALINSMELSGFNIELIIAFQVEMMGKRLFFSLKVKDFQDRLDVDKIAFTLAHSSMFRRLVFALMELAPFDFSNTFINNSYGKPIDLDDSQITAFGADLLGGEYQKKTNMYFKMMNGNYSLDELVAQCTTVVKEHFTEVNFNDPNRPTLPPEFNKPN